MGSPQIYFPANLLLLLKSQTLHPREYAGFLKMVRPQEDISQHLCPAFVLETDLFRKAQLAAPPLCSPDLYHSSGSWGAGSRASQWGRSEQVGHLMR